MLCLAYLVCFEPNQLGCLGGSVGRVTALKAGGHGRIPPEVSKNILWHHHNMHDIIMTSYSSIVIDPHPRKSGGRSQVTWHLQLTAGTHALSGLIRCFALLILCALNPTSWAALVAQLVEWLPWKQEFMVESHLKSQRTYYDIITTCMISSWHHTPV